MATRRCKRGRRKGSKSCRRKPGPKRGRGSRKRRSSRRCKRGRKKGSSTCRRKPGPKKGRKRRSRPMKSLRQRRTARGNPFLTAVPRKGGPSLAQQAAARRAASKNPFLV